MALRLMTKIRFINNTKNARYIHNSSALYKLTQFILSDIGEGIKEVTVRDWFVKVGDKVAQFDDICLVESDKASVNITSRFDGVIKGLYYEVGDTAAVGKPLLDIDTIENDMDSPKITEPSSIKVDDDPSDVPEVMSDNTSRFKKLATPAVRKIALEHNVSLEEVHGTGKDGRVMKEDIVNFLNKFSKPAETLQNDQQDSKHQIVPITGIKKVMVKSMTESNNIPTFGFYDKINVTKLVNFRNEIKDQTKSKGINITYLPFFIKALSKCIEKFPEINSSIDDKCENMILKTSHNIGIAVDTPKGLVVPNIKNVQNLSIAQINRELNTLIEKGRKNQLTPGDLSKGTISISNIGAIGGTYAVPLINPPEVCILAIGAFQTVPMFVDNDKIIKSYTCYLSWSADHRVIDGATIAKFSNMYKEYIENLNYLLLDF